MRISRKYRRIGNYLTGLFFVTICFFGSFLAFKNAELKLKELNSYTGKIIEKGITDSYSSISGKGNLKFKVFYLKLEGLNQILASYNPKKSYGNLDKNLKIGDTVKVYFKMSSTTTKPNLATFQIEKKNIIILNTNDYQFREKIVGYMAILGGFVIIGIAVYQDKKYWKKIRK
ncbi:hypothetical protein [Flavobacterium reichenbachii]|uniref:Uncharacterized protein n=1 Tax=Flavobacterium reichenbachii TaxID=362418 RepID=A0A085ZQ62_9FLAO|nr:hypothetical protein [Flavobacterium reichenbachii]KFF06576.1 hypothetical protein IW19_14130 [Flavobacterium reichenbachii]OXB18819.1 hypothetical protein B0A68_02060 [Flavobacterium reichenbachii]